MLNYLDNGRPKKDIKKYVTKYVSSSFVLNMVSRLLPGRKLLGWQLNMSLDMCLYITRDIHELFSVLLCVRLCCNTIFIFTEQLEFIIPLL